MAVPVDDGNEEALVLDKHREKIPMFIYVVASLSAVGGFLFGYDTGVVSGAMILLRDYFKLDSTMQGVVVSATIVTAWVFSLVAGFLSDRFGRKRVIILASVIFVMGALLMGCAENTAMLITGRIIVGAGIGLASMCVPMYIAEVSPQSIRGTLVTINNCAITLGQMIASIVAGLFSGDPTDGWRYMLGLAAIPALIQFFGFLVMPESPRWLVGKGKYEKSMEVLRRIRGPNANIQEEFEGIKANCLEVEREQSSTEGSVFQRVLRSSSLRMALIVGCSLQIIAQLSGINTVMYYSASIIEMSGIKSKSKAIWLSAAVSSVNCICSLIGLMFVERVGRRRLTLGSLAGVFSSLVVLAVSFQLAETNSPSLTYHDPLAHGTSCDKYSFCYGCIYDTHCGYCFTSNANGTYDGACLSTDANDFDTSKYGLCNSTHIPDDVTWAYDWCPSSYSWMTLLGMLLYLVFFAPGMGPMPWTINSEIYPLWARSTCYSISTSLNWLCNFLVSLTFLDLMQALTKYGTFYFYAGLALLGFVFLFLFLPETKGHSLEDLEGLFDQPWWKDRTTSSEKKTVQIQRTVSYLATANSSEGRVNGKS